MRIREVSFDTFIPACEESILHPLLHRCPRLESLELKSMVCDTTAPIICKILDENGLSDLRHFVLRGHSIQGIQQQIAKVLRSSKPMDSLVLHLGPDQGPVVQSIVEHHKFLKLLDLRKAELSVLVLHDIMTRLPALRSLSAYTNIEMANGESTQGHWKCKEITTLQLTLITRSAESTMDSDKWVESVYKQGLDHIFSETARMKGLQELQIGYNKDLYTECTSVKSDIVYNLG
ncbi:MAG: hypothetical protein J3Q66DRAFT_388095 [Benniella sp.]|nr:MAG: hypothetical protein J3Q66DRAFT_388095 [Benniella sp.]